jgi:hypothetical protein
LSAKIRCGSVVDVAPVPVELLDELLLEELDELDEPPSVTSVVPAASDVGGAGGVEAAGAGVLEVLGGALELGVLGALGALGVAGVEAVVFVVAAGVAAWLAVELLPPDELPHPAANIEMARIQCVLLTIPFPPCRPALADDADLLYPRVPFLVCKSSVSLGSLTES